MRKKIPEHVVVVPDGNRRWAKEKGFREIEGHIRAGTYKHLKNILDEAKKLGIRYVTLWGFSTENFNRSNLEKNNLFGIFRKLIKDFSEDAMGNKVRFRHFGRRDRLPKDLMESIEKLEKDTEEFEDWNVSVCLDYGGRDELIRAINRLLEEGKKEISADDFADYLDTKDVPDPDLIIRTSGEQRLSGLMPFQSVYSELLFVEKHFPDFSGEDLRRAVEEYSNRDRRFGKS